MGNSLEIAAEIAGVPWSTVRSWRKRGQQESAGPYHEFWLSYRRARVSLANRSIAMLNKAAARGNVSAAKYLHQLAGGRALVDRGGDEDDDDELFEIPELPEPKH